MRKSFEIRAWWPRICKNFEIARTIYLNSERSEQCLVTECFFLTCSWRFLRSNWLEQFEFKLEKKILGFRNMQEKLEKGIFIQLTLLLTCFFSISDLLSWFNFIKPLLRYTYFNREDFKKKVTRIHDFCLPLLWLHDGRFCFRFSFVFKKLLHLVALFDTKRATWWFNLVLKSHLVV